MIRYNWKTIRKYTNDDIKKINKYLALAYVAEDKELLTEFFKENKWALKIAQNQDERPNYLLDVYSYLRNDMGASGAEQLIYLDLASYRDVFSYYNTRGVFIHIPVWKIEHVYDVNDLESNRLLNIEDNKIQLLYEIGD